MPAQNPPDLGRVPPTVTHPGERQMALWTFLALAHTFLTLAHAFLALAHTPLLNLLLSARFLDDSVGRTMLFRP